MPRDIPVGNGNVLVSFDDNYLLREFCFPHIGEENHTSGEPFKFGIFTDGDFSWVPDGWEIEKNYIEDSLVTDVNLINPKFELKLKCNDFVDFHENVYVKKITVDNLSDKEKEVRLFFYHDFHISGNNVGDTAAYRPEVKGILHYKAERYFLINACANQKCGVDQFTTGIKRTDSNHNGSWQDAEDGILSANPIAQGSVDSVASITLNISPKSSETCFYWICAAKNWDGVKILNKVIWEKTPALLMQRTIDFWRLWVNKEHLNLDLLPKKVAWLYKRSLLTTRVQTDTCGSIIAATDSDVTYLTRDTYSYVWPRDGALVAYAYDLAGYSEISRRFFKFCARIIEKDGYFLHKYTPSGKLASSWHPWIKDGKKQLPIQEDETALVVWALWNHYVIFKDIEFIKPLYKPLIKNAADFMLKYRDEKTKLPLLSYDLWEERQGILTFTSASVYGGLIAAANFARAFGEIDLAKKYSKGAEEIKMAMEKYLYMTGEKRFARMVVFNDDGTFEVDPTIDASLYGIFAFGVYSSDDEKVKNTMEQVYEKLWIKTPVGGLARYENDNYHRVDEKLPGNSWFITTLWFAEYYIAIAKNKDELQKGLEILEWTADHALPSGILAEQLDPFTGKPISVSPLTWSHAAFVKMVQKYLNKLVGLEKCNICGHSVYRKNI